MTPIRLIRARWTESSTWNSVLGVENAFVLNTMLLSDAAWAALGLRVDDVVLDAQSGYYDHLPIVVDFVIANSP